MAVWDQDTTVVLDHTMVAIHMVDIRHTVNYLVFDLFYCEMNERFK